MAEGLPFLVHGSQECSDDWQAVKRQGEERNGRPEGSSMVRFGRIINYSGLKSIGWNLMIRPYLIANKLGEHRLVVCLEGKEVSLVKNQPVCAAVCQLPVFYCLEIPALSNCNVILII